MNAVFSLALACLALGNVAAEPKAKLPTFNLRADEIFNLVYQLDCLPQGDACPFARLWKEQLGWTAEDDQALEARKQIRRRYSGWLTVDENLDDAPFMLDAPRLLELKKKLLLAAAGARSIAAYRARLELVVTGTDAAQLAALTERFLPRFRRFFGPAQGRMRALTRELGPQLGHASVRRLVAQAMAFYEVPAGEVRELQVQLIPLPPDWSGPTRGEQVEHLSTIEIKPAGTPEEQSKRRGVTGTILLHELFHYFYGAGAGDKARALAQGFASAKEPGAAAGYGLVNEALATVFSVLSRKAYLSSAEFQTELASGRPWYKDTAIDAAARAALPLVEEMLAGGQSLYHARFVADYLQRLRTGMGATLDRPALKLRTLLMVAEDRELRPAMDVIHRAVAAGRQLSAIPLEETRLRDAWLRHPEQSGVILVRGGSLARLGAYRDVLGPDIVARLTARRSGQRAFVQAVKRGQHSVLFVLVAHTLADFQALAERLMSAPAPFDLLALQDS